MSVDGKFQFEIDQIGESIREKNSRLKYQVDPESGEPVVLFTKKQLLESMDKEVKNANAPADKNDRPTQSQEGKS